MEKEILTIGMLAPYFEHGIHGMSIRNSIFKLGLVSNMLGAGIETRTIDTFVNGQFRLILYPLSMLTKEIEVDGKRFVPIEELAKLVVKYLPDTFYDRAIEDLNYWIFTKKEIDSIPHVCVIKLYKWNFAVNIPEHLYIDKSTL